MRALRCQLLRAQRPCCAAPPVPPWATRGRRVVLPGMSDPDASLWPAVTSFGAPGWRGRVGARPWTPDRPAVDTDAEDGGTAQRQARTLAHREKGRQISRALEERRAEVVSASSSLYAGGVADRRRRWRWQQQQRRARSGSPGAMGRSSYLTHTHLSGHTVYRNAGNPEYGPPDPERGTAFEPRAVHGGLFADEEGDGLMRGGSKAPLHADEQVLAQAEWVNRVSAMGAMQSMEAIARDSLPPRLPRGSPGRPLDGDGPYPAHRREWPDRLKAITTPVLMSPPAGRSALAATQTAVFDQLERAQRRRHSRRRRPHSRSISTGTGGGGAVAQGGWRSSLSSG
jgi:hypothetical protein